MKGQYLSIVSFYYSYCYYIVNYIDNLSRHCIVGIKKPNHRKRLKAEIDNLNIGDGLPEHVPGSLEEWLRLLRLEEYLGALHQQGMRSVEDVTTLTWEDLEDIGIVRLGHQKKLLLAIKRVKDIRAGKRIQPLDLARLPPHPGHTQVNYGVINTLILI